MNIQKPNTHIFQTTEIRNLNSQNKNTNMTIQTPNTKIFQTNKIPEININTTMNIQQQHKHISNETNGNKTYTNQQNMNIQAPNANIFQTNNNPEITHKHKQK